MSIVREVELGEQVLKFEFNKFAKQANGSVMVSSGKTQVLVTVCSELNAKETAGDFFPLGVDYIEKAYAIGSIPGGFVKRESKPSEHATLMARVIDRPLRPCFPKGFTCETVITATILSYEHGHAPAPLALIGASTALMISDIPFNGPVAALRLGMDRGIYVIDPPEGKDYELDLNIACKPDAILMVEAGAKILPEEQVLEAMVHAHELMQPIFEMQLEIQNEIGKPKWTMPEKKQEHSLSASAETMLREALAQKQKKARHQAIDDAKEKWLTDNPELDPQAADELWEQGQYKLVRGMALEQNRLDGRGLKDIRPIAGEVELLSQTHGSALFTRGETQSLASVTLAAEEDQQRDETLWDNQAKQRFMLHYNFPPFSVGEARMQRAPSRRELGHGNLARKALLPIIPGPEDFNYTMRVVAETLESNGSSSMAAVCAGTMALMQAGVPIKEPVAGIAMGLIHDKEKGEHAILSDILGDEDHLGDMDFKVAGTKEGITALQMDIKIDGLSQEILREALAQAKEGRLHILDKLHEAIPEVRKEVVDHAPRIFRLKVNSDKIRDLIGPGGRNIKKITSETGVKMDLEESGLINIVAPNATSAQLAKAMIRNFTSVPQVGEVYLGKVVRVKDFGVFVEIKPGTDGLCHITQLSEQRVKSAEEVVKLGDEVLVKVVDIDRQGRIKLSRKDAIGQKPTVTESQ